jgi:lipoate-protein ligase A
LYDFPLGLISDCLGTPPRQPEYREQRSHDTFVRNLPTTAEALRSVLQSEWKAVDVRTQWPQRRTADLVEQRYARDDWNLRL